MNENRTDWYYHEFRAYLLLYAAHADFELSEEERTRILSKCTPKEYQKICRIFEKDSDFRRIETIQMYREKFFPNARFAEKLLSEVAAILNIDENVNLYERNFFRALRKLLVKEE